MENMLDNFWKYTGLATFAAVLPMLYGILVMASALVDSESAGRRHMREFPKQLR